MATIVVPFRGPGGKQRLAPLGDAARADVSAAMLADVLVACVETAPTLVVVPDAARRVVETAFPDTRVTLVPDPGGGQGAAVEAAVGRAGEGPVLVVNADLPCATARDLDALLAGLPPNGVALVEALDGTTNALALASPALFEPLYGPGSAARFRAVRPASATVRTVPIPNLVDDVDTLDDLYRLAVRLGPRTRRALDGLEQRRGAAA